MKAIVYGPHSNTTMKATIEGLERAFGARPLNPPSKYFDPAVDVRCEAELVVVLGQSPICQTLLAAYEAIGVPVLVLDAGYYPGNTAYTRLSLGGLNWIPPGPLPMDRAEVCGLVIEPTAPEYGLNEISKDGPILIIGQKPDDNGHQIDIHEWVQRKIDAFRFHSGPDTDIVFRRHPHDLTGFNPKGARLEEAGGMDVAFGTLADSVSRASVVVTYNSSASLEALKQRIPLSADDSSIYSGRTKFDHVYKSAVQQFLNRVAYAQWTTEELATAEPWEFVTQFVEVKAHV